MSITNMGAENHPTTVVEETGIDEYLWQILVKREGGETHRTGISVVAKDETEAIDEFVSGMESLSGNVFTQLLTIDISNIVVKRIIV